MTKKVGYKIVLYTWVLIIIVFFGLWIFSHSWMLPKSYLLGALTSIMSFIMLMNRTSYIEENKKEPNNSVTSTLTRFLLSGFILAVGVFDERFNAILVLIGLLQVRIVILFYGIFNKKVVD